MKKRNKESIFTASISHELRTPLTSIIGYGDLLSSTKLDNKQMEYLSRMIKSSEYLLSLVGDFLDIARMENGEIQLRKKETRLHTVLMECIETIKGNLGKDVYFKSDIPFLDYTVSIDGQRLKQVILNLLSNASKFTKKGTISLVVKKVEDKEEKVKVVLEIADTGTGMTKKMQKTIFDPFTTEGSTHGIGLGLHISKEIMKLMGGEIKVKSNKGKGSIFTLSFTTSKIRDKKEIHSLLGSQIVIISNKKMEKAYVRLKNFEADIEILDPISNKKIIEDLYKREMLPDMVIFDMQEMPYSVSRLIRNIREKGNKTRCIGLMSKKQIAKGNGNFDNIIISPVNIKDFVYEIEEISSKKKKNHKTIDFSGLKVLVVEDVKISKEYIKEMLHKSFAIKCNTAENGKEAVKKAKKKEYDIIFMDVRMPVMNGYKATRKIRKFNQETSIICMSADVYKDDVAHAKKAGMDFFIGKPLNIQDIERHLFKITKNIKTKSSKKKKQASLKKETISYLEKTFDAKTAKQLLKIAIQNTNEYILKINKDISSSVTPMENMHALKGVFANLGLVQQVKDMSQIENQYKNGNKEKAIKNILLFLEKIYF